MRTGLAIVIFAVCTFTQARAQDESAMAVAEAACGARDVTFDATQDRKQHPTPQPEAGKALIYVIQDIGELQCKGCALTRLGMDGSWVGANQGSSYIFLAADPGEHHLCMNWQSRLEVRSRAYALASLTAEAGKVYYFRARVFSGHLEYSFDLDPVNPDQGKFLVASSAYSVAHPRK